MPNLRISEIPTTVAAATGDMEFPVYDPANPGVPSKATLAQAAALAAPLAAARVSRSAAQSIPNGVETAITWDVEDRDDGGLHDGVNPSRLTANAAGWWQVVAMVSFASHATGIRQVALRKNGAADVAWTAQVTFVGTPAIICSTLVYLAQNDYLEVRGYQNSGGALDAAQHGHFAIARVA